MGALALAALLVFAAGAAVAADKPLAVGTTAPDTALDALTTLARAK
jgi:hypothetical protein